jgi:hypothetical protein
MSFPSNPYQPSRAVGGEPDDMASEVSFVLTPRVLRHATDHYLLHYIPKRLAFGSLLLILISGWAIARFVEYGTIVTLTVSAACLLISAGIYLLLAQAAKSRVRLKFVELGMDVNSASSVWVDDDQFILVSSSGEHRWPRANARLLRTHSGLLISPEPLVAIFVPRNNASSPESYKTLREKLTFKTKTS